MLNKTIAELLKGLEQKDFSSYELTQTYVDKIHAENSRYNAFITLDSERALEQAKTIDEKRAQGEPLGILAGVPIAHKDIFCSKDVKTSCGSKMLDNFIAPYDATVVRNVKNAGAIMVGKTNMDEFAMGSSNETSFYGNVKNPWDLNRVPGGSSGGSASAVSAGLVPGATGTDTGGSIRQPAALTGITGLKPTYGRVSRYGMIAFASSLDQAGPMTRTAEDAALMLEAMSGFDEKDSTSIDSPVPNYVANLNDSLDGKTIGVPKSFFGEGIDTGVADSIQSAIQSFTAMGATIKEIELPNMHLSVPVYYVIAPAEASSNLARYDGVRYGYRAEETKDLLDFYCKTRSEGFGAEVKRRIMIGTYVLSSGYYDAYYLKAQKVRNLIKQDFVKAFQEVDVIMGPTTPTTAFNIGEKTQDPISMYLSDIYTIAVNLAGLPALSVPAGRVSGLPVGLQIIGNYFDEPAILNFAHQYQMQTEWHQMRPEV